MAQPGAPGHPRADSQHVRHPEYYSRAIAAGAKGYVLKDAGSHEIIAAIDAGLLAAAITAPRWRARCLPSATPSPAMACPSANAKC